MKQYEVLELKWKAPEPEDSQVSVDLTVVFESNGEKRIVKGYYAGNGTYAVRFCPEREGVYRYQTEGAVREKGELVCEPADSGNHGMVRADGTHFRHADGTWFYPFGTTVYALVHQEDDLVCRTLETLSEAPFNKVRMCIFPKHYDYNSNEPPYYPFEKREGKWDVDRPCFAFWNRMERYIRRLGELGIQCDLILFHPYDSWGFSKLSRKEALTYLDYAARRLSAFSNVWWSLANEYDLMDYEKEDWECFAHFLHDNDVYGHLLSNHQIVVPWDFANQHTTHICQQTGEIQRVAEWIEQYGKPLMIDETGYEGNIPFDWGNLSGFEMVNKFWTVCVQGGYCTHGETYWNEEEVLWWSKGGELVGESPVRIRFLREILDALPGPVSFSGRLVTEQQFEQARQHMTEEQKQQPFIRLMLKLPWEQAAALANAGRELEGRCGEMAYIKYYARHCAGVGTLELPEDGEFDVEVIDVWEMTRKKALHGVHGKIKVELPGKEGIAVLAVRR